MSLGDGTHQKKRQAYTARGRIPIEKNIVVVDENGTVFESTWPKRANGLVKKGRARWLDEKTICLACPPEKMEDEEMENDQQAEAVTQHIAEIESIRQQPEGKPGGLTLESLLDRMDAIRREMLGMKELLSTMEAITNQGGEDDAGHIAEAASQAFIARETTCQRQLGFLETIYKDHFSAPSEDARAARMRILLDKMNEFLSCMDYSDENETGGCVEALKVVTAFYNDLLNRD